MPRFKDAMFLLSGTTYQVTLRAFSEDGQVIEKGYWPLFDLSQATVSPAMRQVCQELRSEGWALEQSDREMLEGRLFDFMSILFTLRLYVDGMRKSTGKPPWSKTEWSP
jgi:hypothetical protein